MPTAGTTITFKAQREKTGLKTELLKLVPRKGSITLKALQEKAKGIEPARERNCSPAWRGTTTSR